MLSYCRRTSKLAMGMFQNHRNSPSSYINSYSIGRNPRTRLLQFKQYNNQTSSSSNPPIAAAGNKVNSTTITSSSSSSAFVAKISAFKNKCSFFGRSLCNGNPNSRAGSNKKGWFGKLVKLVLITSGVSLGSIYYLNLETVPYTNRTRFVPMWIVFDKILGEILIKNEQLRDIVPENDCESIRLRLILKDIIDGLHREVANKECDDGYFGVKATTKHLDELNWEILLVYSRTTEPMYCFPGKIVVTTNFLQQFDKDNEIATLIAHEVGHVVARHTAESLIKEEWCSIIESISSILTVIFTFLIPIPFVVKKVSHFSQERSQYLKRKECEADYIGLMLMASAGYDPRIAPEVYKKLGSLFGNTKPSSSASHPCGEERAHLLSQDMEKALTIYKNMNKGHSIQQRKEGGLILTLREGRGD